MDVPEVPQLPHQIKKKTRSKRKVPGTAFGGRRPKGIKGRIPAAAAAAEEPELESVETVEKKGRGLKSDENGTGPGWYSHRNGESQGGGSGVTAEETQAKRLHGNPKVIAKELEEEVAA